MSIRALPSQLALPLALGLALALAASCSSAEESRAPDANSCSVGSTFLCGTGGCIPRSQKCDGVPQCTDSSDEAGCSSSSPDAYVPPPRADAAPSTTADAHVSAGACGSVTEEGECTGGATGVKWCEGGALMTITCSTGYACRHDDANHIFDCMPTGSCGSVTWEGGCDDHQSSTPDNSGGDLNYWCDGEGAAAQIKWQDCYPDVCGLVGSHYDCIPYEDSCESANDGECDEPVYCPYGTDQTDCYYYGNTCTWAFDGSCDEPSLCWYTTDNYDCARYSY